MKQELPAMKLRTEKIRTSDKLDTDADSKNIANL